MPIYLPLPPLKVPQSDTDVTQVPTSNEHLNAEATTRNQALLDIAVLDYPTDSYEMRLLTASKRALETVAISPDWIGWFTVAIWTVINNPVEFTTAQVKSFVGYILNEIKDLSLFLWDILWWLGRVSGCVEGFRSGLLSVEDIREGELCQPIRDMVLIAVSIRQQVDEFSNITLLDMLELYVELQVVSWELLVEVLEMIGDADEEFVEWLRSINRDAAKLGTVYGTITAAILVEVATGGSNRGAKAARVGKEALEAAVDIAKGTERVADVAKTAEKTTDLIGIGRLIELLQIAFVRARLRLSNRITSQKLKQAYKIFEKYLVAHQKSFGT